MDQPTSGDVVKSWRKEILGYLKEMGKFEDVDDPLQILKQISGFSARATYLNNLCASSKNRDLTEFRHDELGPFLKEADFQFRIWSRVGALKTSEWEMTRG